jgi:hypothetical protein
MEHWPAAGGYESDPTQLLTIANVMEHVAYMHTLRPRSEEHDEAMRKLYGYMETEAVGLETVHTPPTFFDREVTDEAGLTDAIFSAAQQLQGAVLDRGRGQHGRKGDYFWDGAEDIEEQRGRIQTRLWARAEQLGVTADTWLEKVIAYRG